MRLRSSFIALSALSLLGFAGCSNQNSNGPLKLFQGNYFSMRNQTEMPYYGLVQLKSPALLSNATIVDGKLVIDENLKKQIVSEQDQLIKSLKEVSADIKVIAKYRMVLNAVSIVAPGEHVKKIEKLLGVEKLEEQTIFERPEILNATKVSENLPISKKNSVTFIGAEEAYKRGFKGESLRVGVIDTGVDYTHSMFGGPGTVEAYESVNPTGSTSYFPNAKVVDGIDIVGDNYNPRTDDLNISVPKLDRNPIDLSGHGTHVAGTIAGHGDGTNTYDGVAPEADIYAIKVFGREGGTSSLAVISALEYAADPTEQLKPQRRLDVVNLSLGGSYGKPNILYNEAIKNLTKAGTIVVASAGNSGDNPYIVGAPSTSDDAISIAASIDDMPQNVDFPAIETKIDNELLTEEAIEGDISIPAQSSGIRGELVHLGTGATEIPDSVKEKVKGKIALIDRGGISFVEKLAIAENLGAVGAVILNNQPGNPIKMGGDRKFSFPAVMLTLETGLKIKAALQAKSEVEFNFSPGKRVVKKELIDTITDFSSRGPRSIDSLIKPEIAGPGANIISAEHGTGTKGVMFSGTSMSGPHLAGVMALLRQAYPKLSVKELKALALNNTKMMIQENKGVIPVSLQGAGRVQVAESLNAKVIAMPATLSLGEVPVNKKKTQTIKVTLKNITKDVVTFHSKITKRASIEVIVPSSVTVEAGASKVVNVTFTMSPIEGENSSSEVDGFVTFESDAQKINLPFLAVVNKISSIKVSSVSESSSEEDSALSDVTALVTNSAANKGTVLPFNLLGSDNRKQVKREGNLSENLSCDLEVAGYRIVETSEGNVLEFGIKFYDTLTFWQPCDVSVQFDHDRDGVTDQELIGIIGNYVPGVEGGIQSVFMDAKKTRELRKVYEQSIGKPTAHDENYEAAIVGLMPFTFFDHSTISILRVKLDQVTKGQDQVVGIKLASMNFEGDSDVDDFLADHETKWQELNLSTHAAPFLDLPQSFEVNAGKTEEILFKRGYTSGKLLLLMPQNAPVYKATVKDQQSTIL